MIAIGDAEGTVSIMQLCKPFYEPAHREKEEMGKIFERESRREKALSTAKKQERDRAEKEAKEAKIRAEKEAIEKKKREAELKKQQEEERKR